MLESERPPGEPTFRVEKVETPNGRNSISFSPERGGIPTSLVLDDTEVLYMDQSTFDDPKKNVRGGIPVLFPNSGPLQSEKYPNMPQHGIARISSAWKKKPLTGPQFEESLKLDGSDPRFPYKCTHIIGAKLQGGSCVISQGVVNDETEKALPISMGLHPYFKVRHQDRPKLRFDFAGGDTVASRLDEWSNDRTTVFTDNPGTMTIVAPGHGTLTLTASPEYKKIAFWALPEKNFICVEPVMNVDGGLVDIPVLVPPGKKFEATFAIQFVREP